MRKYASFFIFFLALPAFAVNSDLYATGGLGKADVTVGDGFLNDGARGFSETAVGYNLAAGIRVNQYFGLEAGVYNAGSGVESLFEGDSVEFENKYLVGTARLDFDNDLFVALKAGRMNWRAMADGDYYTGDGRARRHDSSEMFIAVLGLTLNKRFALDVNHLIVDIADDFDIKITSVNFTYSFFSFAWGL